MREEKVTKTCKEVSCIETLDWRKYCSVYFFIITIIFGDKIEAKKIPWKIRLRNAKYEWSWQWCRGNS